MGGRDGSGAGAVPAPVVPRCRLPSQERLGVWSRPLMVHYPCRKEPKRKFKTYPIGGQPIRPSPHLWPGLRRARHRAPAHRRRLRPSAASPNLPPHPHRQVPNFPPADPPAHQPQRRIADRRRHPPHLAVTAFGDRQFDPRIGDALAVSHRRRSEEHTSELQSLMRISYAVFCLKKKKKPKRKRRNKKNQQIKQQEQKNNSQSNKSFKI